MDDLRHLMLVPDSMSREDIAANAAIPLVAAGGPAALTLRAVGEQSGYSPQAVHQWFGSRAALHRAVAGRFVARWTRWVDLRTGRQGIASLLPENDEVAGWARVWLALHHLARADDEVASYLAYTRSVERDSLARLAGPGGSPEALVELHALVEGLRLQLCSEVSTDSYAEACRLLDRALARSQVPSA
ncbi:TetR family transcriptional regulator [Nocardioides euryhalodurans]|uniref:TetR family transcriptional regulator n=1 Tax=Nocardioides euryhalodurans TaxID=2518370 RepID=A0A4P7GMX0_9ACTN|nr:TetR family transcriptional regulator [Nocardioides euryhalodurans]QBR93370.1 TetR family transcriptional regulator [Nocardioides euryhalodurans]